MQTLDDAVPDDAGDHDDGFSGTRTAKIVGITYRQLDYWARTDLIRPSISDAQGSGSRRRYSYNDLVELKTFHERQIRYMQHERLIHLLVTLFFAVFFMLSLGFGSVTGSLPALGLAALTFLLLAPYIVHYYRLENGVQRWYHLTNRIDKRIGVVSAVYDEKEPPKGEGEAVEAVEPPEEDE